MAGQARVKVGVDGSITVADLGNPEIWGVIGYYTGFSQSSNTLTSIPPWEEAYISDDALNGWLSPANPADEFSMNITEQGGGGLWVVEARAQIFEDGGTAAAGDYIGIGNLMQAGGAYNVEDVHAFEPFDIFTTWANDATLSVVATRVIPASQTVKFVTMEVINACAIGTFINQAELVVWRAASGGGNFSTP